MRAVRAIHRDDIRQAPRRVGTTIVGRDPHSCGRFDVIGRMAGIRDRDLVDLCRSRAKAYRCCARWRVRHRKTFAAARGILGGSRYDQLTQQGKRDGKRSQHGGVRGPAAATLYRAIPPRQSLVREACCLCRFAAHARRGLIFHVAARMPAVINPVTGATSGTASVSTAVAAHPIEEKASAKVASRDEVWRRRNWLRRACTRNQSWIAVADAEATMTPTAVTAACSGEANSSAVTSGAKITLIAISTTSILARMT